MSRQICILLIITLHIPVFSWAETSILSFTKNQYQAASQNWSVALDNNDIAYFGNGMGLLEFDGLSWQLHPSSYSSIIRAVATDNFNRIYTAGYRELGYWERDDFNVLNYTSLTHLVDSMFSLNEEFWNVLVKKDKVYFQSFSGIYIYQSGSFSIIKPGGFINYSTKIDEDIYVSIQNKGIFKILDGHLVPFIESTFFMDKSVRFFSECDNPSSFLIGTESHGLFKYNKETEEIEEYAPQLTRFLSQNKINHGLITSSGTIVLGTILNGVIALDSKQQVVFAHNKDTGLQSSTVLGMAQDKESNVWLALDRGVDFMCLPETKSYEIVPNEKLGAVYTAALYNGNLYLGTNQGLYMRSWNDNKSDFTLIPNTQTQVWDCKVIDDQLFVGHNSGTFVLDEESIRMISEQAGGYSIIPHPSQKDKLIQSTYAHLELYSYENEKWVFSRTIQGFNNLIRFIEFDHQNNLWASHLYDGIYKLNLNNTLDSVASVKTYEIPQNNKNHKVNSSVFKVEGRLVFTSGKQLYTYNDLNDSIVPYTYLNEQLHKFASSHRIVKAREHHYWFITQQRIGYFKIKPDSVQKIKEYPTSLFQNLMIPNYENLAVLDDENILVCLENGYALVNTTSKMDDDNIGKYVPLLKHIQIQNNKGKTRRLSVNTNFVKLPFNFNSLKVQYAFPLLNDEPLDFYYKISGLQEQWLKLADMSALEINRIPPGEYTLSVKMINIWDNSSQIHQLKIKVDQPWYRSNVALLIYVIILIIIAYLFRRVIVRKVSLKESHIREEKEKEIIKLRNENLKSELTFKSQQLASSTMSIIKKNEFLIGLKKMIKHQKENLGSRYPDKYYQDLISKIDQNISGDDDWKVFDANFQQTHEEFIGEMKKSYPELTPNDLRLCAFLRINLTSKEIAPLLGISVRGVENHRYRLRKKLKLASDDNLTEYILMK